MNFGIIGFGNIARKFVRSITYTSGGKVHAIASHSLDEKDSYLQSHPLVKLYRDYEELLNDEDIEAVYIALPHYEHKKWIIEAIKHHKKVLCEKPLVLKSEDIDEINQYVKEYQGYCLEAFKTKFNRGFKHLKEDLKLIGNIKSIEANFCFDASSKKESYLFDVKQGGALNDVGSYVVGFVLGMIDVPIESVESTIELENEIEMNFKATLNFENEVQGKVEGSINYNKERYALIKGEKGEIYIPMFNRVVDYTIHLENEVIQKTYPIEGDDMTLEIQAVIDQDTTTHTLQDSKRIQETIERIRKEAKA